MVLTSDARISIQSFYAREDGLDISKPCVLLMFVLLALDDRALEECPRV